MAKIPKWKPSACARYLTAFRAGYGAPVVGTILNLINEGMQSSVPDRSMGLNSFWPISSPAQSAPFGAMSAQAGRLKNRSTGAVTPWPL